MLQETLKEATKGNHDELEQLMFVGQIMGGTLSLSQYKHILLTNYLVHQVVETDLYEALSPALAAQLDLAMRLKLPALTADMEEMKLFTPVSQDVLPKFNFEKSDAAILGAMYVLEGATLGGNVIVKRLKNNPEISGANPGFHYYQVYNDQLIPNWKKFCEVLNQQPEHTFNASVESAQAMFGFIAEVQRVVGE